MSKLTKNKLFVLAVALMLVVSFGIAGCLPGSSPEPAAPAPAPEPAAPAPEPAAPEPALATGPIKIGFSVALTGWAAVYEEQIHQAALAAEAWVNAEGGVNGRPIELIVYDSESTVELSALHAIKAVEEDKVIVFISELMPSLQYAQYEYIRTGNTPFIITVGGPQPPDVFVPGSNIFNYNPPYDYFAEASLEYLVTDLGLTKMAFLGTADESVDEDLAWMLDSIEAKFPTIEVLITESVDPEATDVTAQWTRVKAANPEAIHFYGSGPVIGPVMKAMKLLDMSDIPFAGTTGVVTTPLLALIAEWEPDLLILPAMPPATAAFPGLMPADHPIQIENELMWEAWESYWGDEKGTENDIYLSWAFFGWGTVDLAVEALRQAGPLPADLTEAREATRYAMENKVIDMPTTWGLRTITPTDHLGLPSEAPALLTMVDGEVVLLKLLD